VAKAAIQERRPARTTGPKRSWADRSLERNDLVKMWLEYPAHLESFTFRLAEQFMGAGVVYAAALGELPANCANAISYRLALETILLASVLRRTKCQMPPLRSTEYAVARCAHSSDFDAATAPSCCRRGHPLARIFSFRVTWGGWPGGRSPGLNARVIIGRTQLCSRRGKVEGWTTKSWIPSAWRFRHV